MVRSTKRTDCTGSSDSHADSGDSRENSRKAPVAGSCSETVPEKIARL